VPSGLKRYYGSGDLHFITASCYRRHPLLASASRRDLFIKVLEQVRRRYQFVLVGYVVMPEHFHLLISEPEKGNPSTVIQALKLGIVRQLFPTSPKGREKWGTPTSRSSRAPEAGHSAGKMTVNRVARTSPSTCSGQALSARISKAEIWTLACGTNGKGTA
jgi:REP element-mobilizing transposase RayT